MENFVVLEGIDGSGTTTQLGSISSALRSRGVKCFTTAEPTSSPIGLFIRSVLAGKTFAEQSTVAYLFAADRNEHIYGKDGILAHLKDEVVLCDRYVFSSVAYQGLGCGQELPWELNGRFPIPGLTIFFSIAPELSMRRVATRENLEIYEKLNIQKSVAAAYDSIIASSRKSGWNIVEIDAALPISEVSALAIHAVSSYLESIDKRRRGV